MPKWSLTFLQCLAKGAYWGEKKLRQYLLEEMAMWKWVVALSVLAALLLAGDANAKKKRSKSRSVKSVGQQKINDYTEEVLYVRSDLLKIFWSTSVEKSLKYHIRGLTPYVGLNAWIAHKVALGCAPCELPELAKQKYCNLWIEEQSYEVTKRLFRISPEGWCYLKKPS